jgi:hypothetical protein
MLQSINSESGPHGRASDPQIYSSDLSPPPRPPVWGPGRPQWGPKVTGQNTPGP